MKVDRLGLTFVKPLPGFEKLKDFSLFPIENNPDFSLLQSEEDKNIGLVTVSPFLFKPDYELKLSDDVIKKLNIITHEDVEVVSIVTLAKDVKNITYNLKAPVIINVKNGYAIQVILDNDEYMIKLPLVEEWNYASSN